MQEQNISFKQKGIGSMEINKFCR